MKDRSSSSLSTTIKTKSSKGRNARPNILELHYNRSLPEFIKVVDFKELGEKKFAYPIKKETNGYYFLMHIEADKATEAELNRKASLDENILRHLIIKLDEE